MRGPFESSRAEVPLYEQELKYVDKCGFGYNLAGQNMHTAYPTVDSAYPMSNECERSAGRNYLVETSAKQFGGPGIKIRTHHPQQQQISDNFIKQGTAQRRIRSQTNISPASMSKTKVPDQDKEQDEVESAFTEVMLFGVTGLVI